MFLRSRLALDRISLLSGSLRAQSSLAYYTTLSLRRAYIASSNTPSCPLEVEMTEEIDLKFMEEPLGSEHFSPGMVRGKGYVQVDFHDKIGPDDRYEILRKLGWGRNVSGGS